MATHDILTGRQHYLEIEDSPAASGNFTFLCTVDSIDKAITTNEDEAFVNDCADPSALATRVTSVSSISHVINIGGLVDVNDAQYEQFRALANSAAIWNFREQMKPATGGWYESFAARVTNLTESKQGNGLTRFTATLSVQGGLTKTDY